MVKINYIECLLKSTKIEELVNKVAHYKICCTVDLKSAHYQVPISEKDKIYTASKHMASYTNSAGYRFE